MATALMLLPLHTTIRAEAEQWCGELKGTGWPEPASEMCAAEGRRVETALCLAEAARGQAPPRAGWDCALTYKQGMYTRLPTITSMNSSGEQSSRKSTSALKISGGTGQGQCALAAPGA